MSDDNIRAIDYYRLVQQAREEWNRVTDRAQNETEEERNERAVIIRFPIERRNLNK